MTKNVLLVNVIKFDGHSYKYFNTVQILKTFFCN